MHWVYLTIHKEYYLEAKLKMEEAVSEPLGNRC